MYQLSNVQFVFNSNSKIESMAAETTTLNGSNNIRCSAFKDSAAVQMHQQVMPVHIQHHAPIARALLTIDDDIIASHSWCSSKSRAQDS